MRRKTERGLGRRLFIGTLASAAAIAIAPSGASAVEISNTFDASAQSWRTFAEADCNAGFTPATHIASGGNPGGMISGADSDPNDFCSWYFISPSLAGNQVGNYGGTVSFDLLTTTPASAEIQIGLVGESGALFKQTGAAPAEDTWVSSSFLISETAPGGWIWINEDSSVQRPATRADFFDVLGSFGFIQILGDFIPSSTGGFTRLDNFVLTDGPVADTDGDGVTNSADQCPLEVGPASNNGCPEEEPPPTDSDGDGVVDSEDACPSEAGPASNAGCPEEEPGKTEACKEAERKLERAKAKLKKLKQKDASKKKIKKAKKKVKKAKQAVAEEC